MSTGFKLALLASMVLLAFLLAAIGYLFARWVFIAFPPDPSMKDFMPLMQATMAAISALTAPIIVACAAQFLKPPAPRVDLPQVPEPAEMPATPPVAFEELDYARNRKEQYKQAFLQMKEVAAFEVRLRSRYAAYRAIFLIAFVTALCHFLSGAAATKVTAAYAPGGVVDVVLPWFVQYAQSLMLLVTAAFVPALIYKGCYLHQRRCAKTIGSAISVGGLGTAAAGIIFFLQISPELLGLILNGPDKIPVTSWFQPPFYVFLVFQRLVALPVVAAVGCMIAFAATSSAMRNGHTE